MGTKRKRIQPRAPAFVIGVPVGFVNVVEAKEMRMQSGIPYIVARGRKGGAKRIVFCMRIKYKPNQPRA